MDTKQRPVEDKIEKPASRWVNWYIALVGVKLSVSHECYDKGDKFRGGLLHPSKDVAETISAKWMAKDLEDLGFFPAEYLGAFPEGQDAP